MSEKPEIYYDRTVSADFLSLFTPDGGLSELVDIAKGGHLVDLQLRAYPHSRSNRATLYCGLTKFLDITNLGKKYRFSAHSTFMDRGPLVRWMETLTLSQVIEQKDSLMNYIDDQVRNVAARFTREGAVQSMLCIHAGSLFSVVDREAVVGFRNTGIRKTCYSTVRAEVQSGLPKALEGYTWAKKIPAFGGELDLLAVGHDGSLLVIEVKPGSNRRGITWAALQATFYAELFRAWVDGVGDKVAASAIDRMLRQRIEIGLSLEPMRKLRTPLQIKPVVAIGGDVDKLGLERLLMVRNVLPSLRGRSQDLEVWQVNPSVSCEQLG